MLIRLIRSATLRLDYAGQSFLIDPCFCPRHTRPSYAGISANPLVDLPCPPEEILRGVGTGLVSHLHSDHFDPAARALLPRELPLLCQPEDAGALRELGFSTVNAVEETLVWQGVSIRRTRGRHGSGAVLAEMGEASGFVLRAEGEPTLYWAGDTVWCDEVADLLRLERPDVVVIHAAGATWGGGTLILMDAEQAVRVCEAAPQAVVVATHLESYDHGTVTRAALRAHADARGIPSRRLLIPGDGETPVPATPGGPMNTVGIFLYDDVEVLDFAGPFEVFSTADRVHQRLDPGAARRFEVLTLSERGGPVRARGGLVVQASHGFSDAPPLDLLLIPGGVVTRELARPAVLAWIRDRAGSARITASVCTGAFLLGGAGLLQGRRAATHWEDVDALGALLPETSVERNARWVDEGPIVTSAGISAGLDMSLHLVERLAGLDLARRTARQMDYAWNRVA